MTLVGVFRLVFPPVTRFPVELNRPCRNHANQPPPGGVFVDDQGMLGDRSCHAGRRSGRVVGGGATHVGTPEVGDRAGKRSGRRKTQRSVERSTCTAAPFHGRNPDPFESACREATNTLASDANVMEVPTEIPAA